MISDSDPNSSSRSGAAGEDGDHAGGMEGSELRARRGRAEVANLVDRGDGDRAEHLGPALFDAVEVDDGGSIDALARQRSVHATLEELGPQAHDRLEGVGDGDRLELDEADDVG